MKKLFYKGKLLMNINDNQAFHLQAAKDAGKEKVGFGKSTLVCNLLELIDDKDYVPDGLPERTNLWAMSNKELQAQIPDGWIVKYITCSIGKRISSQLFGSEYENILNWLHQDRIIDHYKEQILDSEKFRRWEYIRECYEIVGKRQTKKNEPLTNDCPYLPSHLIYLQSKTGIHWGKIIKMRDDNVLKDYLQDKNIPDFKQENVLDTEEIKLLFGECGGQ